MDENESADSVPPRRPKQRKVPRALKYHQGPESEPPDSSGVREPRDPLPVVLTSGERGTDLLPKRGTDSI